MNRAETQIAADRLAVCSWSLQPTSPSNLVTKLRATGINRVQLALDPLREAPEIWSNVLPTLETAGLKIISGMFGCVGEDYSTLESIRETGGIAPDATWNQNLANMRLTAEIAGRLQLRLVTFHAGFLPHDEADPGFAKMLHRLSAVAEIFGAHQIAVGLETGQETAPALAGLLKKLNRSNVGVNFDPANMILYGKGDPIEALRLLSPWIQQIHIKDAKRATLPGRWGEEVVVGSGDIDWRRFFDEVKNLNFTGNLVIEREAGSNRIEDIRGARNAISQFFT